jgi:hypothetical protein
MEQKEQQEPEEVNLPENENSLDSYLKTLGKAFSRRKAPKTAKQEQIVCS